MLSINFATVYSVYDYEGIPCVQKYLFTLKLKQHHAECVGAVYIVFLALEHKCAWFEQVFRYCSNNGIGIIEFKPKGKVIDINLKNVPKINRN